MYWLIFPLATLLWGSVWLDKYSMDESGGGIPPTYSADESGGGIPPTFSASESGGGIPPTR
jgi:hypothetical protein